MGNRNQAGKLEFSDIVIGARVVFIGTSDQFAGAVGTVCRVHDGLREMFDVAYDELRKVTEERCSLHDWTLLARMEAMQQSVQNLRRRLGTAVLDANKGIGEEQ